MISHAITELKSLTSWKSFLYSRRFCNLQAAAHQDSITFCKKNWGTDLPTLITAPNNLINLCLLIFPAETRRHFNYILTPRNCYIDVLSAIEHRFVEHRIRGVGRPNSKKTRVASALGVPIRWRKTLHSTPRWQCPRHVAPTDDVYASHQWPRFAMESKLSNVEWMGVHGHKMSTYEAD